MNKPMSEEELAEIEARAAKARPGPWRTMPNDMCPGYSFVCYGPDRWYEGTTDIHGRKIPQLPAAVFGAHAPDADCEFTSAARTDVPSLLAEIRRLQALLKEAQP